MTKSLPTRKQQMAKEPVPPPGPSQPKELGILAIPYSSTSTSLPPIHIVPVKAPDSPPTLYSRPSSPIKIVSSSSSVYPSSTHSTRSSILAALPPVDTRPCTAPSQKRKSTFAAAEVWEENFGASPSTYEVEPENRLPAYLGPHIINSERAEDQPAVLFAMTGIPIEKPTAVSTPRSTSSARKNSRFIESEPAVMLSKRKRGFWSCLRLGRKQNAMPSEDRPLFLGNLRSRRFTPITDTVITEETAVASDESPQKPVPGKPPLDEDYNISEAIKEQNEKGAVEVVKKANNEDAQQDLCHTITVEIPRESQFVGEFWARFPRIFI